MITLTAAARTGKALPAIIRTAVLAAVLAPGAALCQILFEDLSDTDGIDYVGESWGAAWGDFNGDGKPDLWTSNHGPTSSLWLNNGDGTFTNVSDQVLPEDIVNGSVKDEHGAAWADMDNDGDQDVLQAVAGGSQDQPNRMYINEGGTLTEQAASLNLALPEGRSRTPLWLDQNNDGLLDVIIATATSNGQLLQAPSVNLQREDAFVTATAEAQLNLDETTLMVMHSDVTGDAAREVLVGATTRSLRVYDAAALPFLDIGESIGLGTPKGMNDGVLADLTGDLVPEIFIVEGEFGQDVVQTNDVTVESHLSPRISEEGFTFVTGGAVTFELYPVFNVNPSQIFIGASGFNPTSREFTLFPEDTAVHGTPSYIPGGNTGFYIGYDPGTQQWRITLSHSAFMERNVVVTGAETITDVLPIGFSLEPTQDPDNLLVRDGTGVYRDEAAARGITEPSFGRNIGVGDFDNDMDLDLYVGATGPVTNLPNLLYENDGSGNFTIVPGAGGAAGGIAGRSDAVAVADFDEDGFLDLFVTNGSSKPPFEADGPYQLFRNLGNDNHWLAIDLEGVRSNRDGIGARIVASSGGVAQMREYGNDMHFRTQNHRRAHFGLADNTVVDSITVDWPSGITQVVTDIPANQRLRIVEPLAPSIVGQPKYEPGISDGIYAWYDTKASVYRLRASGGNDVAFRVRLLTDAPMGTVTPAGLGRNDRLTELPFGFELDVVVNNSENGVDFTLAPGARALLSVEREGVTNPRLLTVGAGNGRLSPAGWIVDSSELAALPAFTPGVDMGLHVGTGASATDLQARWTGSEFAHVGALTVLGAEAFTSITPVSLEPVDTLQSGANFVQVSGGVTGGQDGVDVELAGSSLTGISYLHDSLFQSHRVNSGQFVGGLANAFWLPTVQPGARPKPGRADRARARAATPRTPRRLALQQ
ncbi:MAG: CRTAC1 family protein [Pseudomonadota bacterium]